MPALSINVPFPVFQDRDGQPLDNGYVYIGTPYLDPQTNPVQVYFDDALTIPADQPLRTINGYVSNAGTPAQLYVNGVNFSIKVLDSKANLVYSFPDGSGISPNASGVQYDPAGAGAVSTTVQAKLRETVSVKDFGAVGDGVADDTAAIQAAVSSLASGSTLLFPPGSYKVTAPITFSGKSNVTINGYGSTVYCGPTRIQSYFNIDSSSDIDIIGFTFDAKMQSMPLYTPGDYGNIYNAGVYTYNGAQNVNVKDCSFINLYTVAGFFRNSTNVFVADCRFKSPLQTQNQQLEHLLFQTSAEVNVNNCNFDNAASVSPSSNAAGIYASGITKYITIDGCTFNYCGRDNAGAHRVGVIDFYYDVDNVTVTNCVSKNTMAEFMRLSTCNNAVISNNQVEINPNCEIGSNTLSMQSGAVYLPSANTKCRNIVISDNVFVNDSGVNIASCIGVFAYDWGAWSENINIESNNFSNFRRMVAIRGPFNGVKISNNQSNSFSGSFPSGIIDLDHMAGIASSYGSQSNSFFNNLEISNNLISSRGDNGFISLSLNAITTTAYVGEFKVSNNTIDATTTLSANIGININLTSATPTNTTLKVENNFIQRYNYAFQLNNCGNVVLANNRSQKNTNYLIQGGNLSFNAYGNITRNGLLFGKSKLSGGTVTVLGSDCNTGDNIMVSYYDNSGAALGSLYLANIGNGVFDVKSTSGTDAANVIWHIVH